MDAGTTGDPGPGQPVLDHQGDGPQPAEAIPELVLGGQFRSSSRVWSVCETMIFAGMPFSLGL